MSKSRLYIYELVGRVALAFCAYRLPGIFMADVHYYALQGQDVGIDHLPYRDFTWEYPPLTVIVLLMVKLTNGDTVPFHLLFLACTIMLEWGSLQLLRSYDSENFWRITRYWSVTILPMGVIGWNRMDFLPLFFMVLALVAYLRGRSAVVWTLLGFLAKLWPVLLVIGLFARRRFREVALTMFSCAVLTALWYQFSPHGFVEFLKYRAGEGFQLESIPGSILHWAGRRFFFKFGAVGISDSGYEWVQTFMFAATIVGLSALGLAAYFRRRFDPVLLIGAAVALTLVASRIISAQFVVWLAPFVVLRLQTHKRLAIEYAAVLVLTLFFLFFYEQMAHEDAFQKFTFALILRNIVLLGMTVDMIQAAFRPKADSPDEEAAAYSPR